MSSDPNLGEQALDRVAEAAIESQLDQTEDVNVDIRTDPVKIVQGKVDSVSVKGKGMVMKRELRVESLEIDAESVAIDPLKAIVGQLELTQSTNAAARICLTEEDINRALKSDYLQRKLKPFEIDVDGTTQIVTIQTIDVQLPEEDLIHLDVSFLMQKTNETKQFSGVARPYLKDRGYRIELELIKAEGQGLSIEFVNALFEQITRLLDLRNFDMQGARLKLDSFDVKPGQLILSGIAAIDSLSIES